MKSLFLLLSAMFTLTSMMIFDKTLFKTIGGISVFEIREKNVFVFTSGLMIDADGAPHAYNKDSKKALDFLGNAGKPGNWWAVVTDNGERTGNPIIQTENDPAPGFYISTTSLEDPTKKIKDPHRYVNAENIPYIALPGKLSKDFKLGDIACVVNKVNNKKCFAIFADTGPSNKIGEGSIFLANQLGIKSSPKNGGVTSGIVYILFKNSGKKTVLTNQAIQAIGDSLTSPLNINEIIE